MKTLFITHIDLDGISATLLVEYYDLDRDLLVGLDYNDFENHEILERIENYDRIYMIDVCCSEEYYNRLISMEKEVWIFDHHESSSWCVGKPNVYHDQSISGAKVFFNYLMKERKREKSIIYDYIDIVSTYDLFRTKDSLWDKALSLSYALYSDWEPNEKGIEMFRKFIEDQKHKFRTSSIWYFTSQEQYAIFKAKEKEAQLFQEALNSMEVRKDSKNNWFGVICLSSKVSAVSRLILEERLDLDYLVIINTYKGINGRVSCRSRENEFNCTELSVFEGHKPAAGTDIEPSEVKRFLFNSALSFSYGEADSIFYGG